MIYRFNEDVTSAITSSVTIVTSVPVKINSITLNGINTNQTTDGTITITILDSTDSTNVYRGTITVKKSDTFSKDGNEVTFYPDFATANMNATITISTTRTNATVYGGATRTDEAIFSGLGARVSSGNMFNCTISMILVEEVWKIGTSGYAELAANPYNPWEDWERDDEGYPLNVSVWRIDGRNRGFPFIITDEAKAIANSILIFTEDSLISGRSMVFTADSLEPVRIVPISTLG